MLPRISLLRHPKKTLAVICVATASLSGLAYLKAQEGFNSNLMERRSTPGLQSLEIQLLYGLRAITDEHKLFIHHVVTAVEAGQLSRAFVTTVYAWARQRNEEFPYPYFEIAMRKLAERRGVTLPN